jgi:hypothetical protein
LRTVDIKLASDGTTDLKLQVLPQLMHIHQNARMIGDYNNSMSLLATDKLAGTVASAMGFVNVKGLYVPNTSLKKDMREVACYRRKVAMIFKKQRLDLKYSTLSYIAKGLTIDDDIFQQVILDKVDLQNLNSSFQIPRTHDGA